MKAPCEQSSPITPSNWEAKCSSLVILYILHAGTIQNCQERALGRGGGGNGLKRTGAVVYTLLCDCGQLLQLVSPAFGAHYFDRGRGICTVPRKHAVPNTVRLGPISNTTLQTIEKCQTSEYYWKKIKAIFPLHKGIHRV